MSRTNPRVVAPTTRGILSDDPASRTRRVRVLANLLDSSISIPGTPWKIGFDPIVGLIPGIGDLIGALLSGYNVLGLMAIAVIVLVLILGAGLALGIFAARLLWGLRTR